MKKLKNRILDIYFFYFLNPILFKKLLWGKENVRINDRILT